MSRVPKIFGYDLAKLPAHFRDALDTYLKNGAIKAILRPKIPGSITLTTMQKVGEIESVQIL